jgi:hypothetical protein
VSNGKSQKKVEVEEAHQEEDQTLDRTSKLIVSYAIWERVFSRGFERKRRDPELSHAPRACDRLSCGVGDASYI